MRKLFYIVLGIVMMHSCKNAPQADEAEVGDPIEIEASSNDSSKWLIDTTLSAITFIGSKPTASHHGLFKVREGKVEVDSAGNLKSGNFIISIPSLEVTDLDPESNLKLAKHLLSNEFFDASKHPEASFQIVTVLPYTPDSFSSEKIFTKNPTHIITGNLRLRDSTKSIRFPARIYMTENAMTAQANFNIDRTLWGLSYGNDKSLGDRFISPIVNIGLEIRTK